MRKLWEKIKAFLMKLRYAAAYQNPPQLSPPDHSLLGKSVARITHPGVRRVHKGKIVSVTDDDIGVKWETEGHKHYHPTRDKKIIDIILHNARREKLDDPR